MMLPFTAIQLPLGIFYWPVALFIILGTVNSVNLTDGIDGLAASVNFGCAVAFMFSSKILGCTALAAISAALAGGCLGFLVWNFHPAKVFMGDTGSLFLGGMICAIAFGIKEPLLLIPFGVIYIIEALSDIIQMISFKSTGKRVFKMAPIHHHFEMSRMERNENCNGFYSRYGDMFHRRRGLACSNNRVIISYYKQYNNDYHHNCIVYSLAKRYSACEISLARTYVRNI